MNKKLLWIVVIVLVAGAGAYFAYVYGIKKGADAGSVQALDDVAKYLNKADAMRQKCVGRECGVCPGNVVISGGHRVCWRADGSGIVWIDTGYE